MCRSAAPVGCLYMCPPQQALRRTCEQASVASAHCSAMRVHGQQYSCAGVPHIIPGTRIDTHTLQRPAQRGTRQASGPHLTQASNQSTGRCRCPGGPPEIRRTCSTASCQCSCCCAPCHRCSCACWDPAACQVLAAPAEPAAPGCTGNQAQGGRVQGLLLPHDEHMPGCFGLSTGRAHTLLMCLRHHATSRTACPSKTLSLVLLASGPQR